MSGLSYACRHVRWFWRPVSCFTGGSCWWLLRQRHLDITADSIFLSWSSQFAQMIPLCILWINISAVMIVWSSVLYGVLQLCSVISTFLWTFLTAEQPVWFDLCFCLIFMFFVLFFTFNCELGCQYKCSRVHGNTYHSYPQWLIMCWVKYKAYLCLKSVDSVHISM